MNIKNLPIEELELMSYNDLTLEILKESKEPLNTPTIFKTICDLLEYTDEDYTNKIGDYYTALTTDKRFVLLDSNKWDIRDNHSIDIVVDEDEDETLEEVEDTDEEMIEGEYELEENDSIDDIIDDDIDDDIDDLTIVDDDEELEE